MTQIRCIRESLNLSQQSLAAMLEVSQASVSRWESSIGEIRARDALRIVGLARHAGLNLDVHDIVRDDPPNKTNVGGGKATTLTTTTDEPTVKRDASNDELKMPLT